MKSQAGSPVLPKQALQGAEEVKLKPCPELLGVFCPGQLWLKAGAFTLLVDWPVEMLLVEQH